MARLVQMIPLLVLLGVAAGIVYLVATYRYSASKAKELLIRFFTVLTSVLSLVCLLFTLYAQLEQNAAVTEMGAVLLGVALVGLAITTVCRLVFNHNHPVSKGEARKTELIDGEEGEEGEGGGR